MRERMATLSALRDEELERWGMKNGNANGNGNGNGVLDGVLNGNGSPAMPAKGTPSGAPDRSRSEGWADDEHEFGNATKNPRSNAMTRQGSTISMYREYRLAGFLVDTTLCRWDL